MALVALTPLVVLAMFVPPGMLVANIDTVGRALVPALPAAATLVPPLVETIAVAGGTALERPAGG